MTNAISFRMAQGIPGDISRLGNETVEAIPYGTTAFPAYGLAAQLSGNTVIPNASATPAVYGLLIRPFPMEDFTPQTGAPNSGPALGTSTPPTAGIANIMTRGYMTVYCRAGAPAIGGAVYVRYASPSGNLIVGGLEATSVAGANIAIPNARWTGTADSNGNAEVFFDNP